MNHTELYNQLMGLMNETVQDELSDTAFGRIVKKFLKTEITSKPEFNKIAAERSKLVSVYTNLIKTIIKDNGYRAKDSGINIEIELIKRSGGKLPDKPLDYCLKFYEKTVHIEIARYSENLFIAINYDFINDTILDFKETSLINYSEA